MAYAEKNTAVAVLRAALNGQSAGRRKPPQRLNGKRQGPGEDTVYSRCRKRLRNTGKPGVEKDINTFKDSEFRKATDQETADEETQGYVMGLRPDTGGSTVFNVLTRPASIAQKAYLRDAEDGDTGIIYVKNGAYQKETVTADGAYTVSDVGGGKKYAFSVGASSGYKKSTITLSGHAGVNRATGSVTIRFYTPSGANIFADAGSYGTVAASDMTLVYTVSTPPSGGGGGSVTVIPSVAPTYSGKTLVPAVLQRETTSEKRYAPWRYVPSSKTEETKTVLAQSGSTAVQNFAFDGMEDID